MNSKCHGRGISPTFWKKKTIEHIYIIYTFLVIDKYKFCCKHLNVCIKHVISEVIVDTEGFNEILEIPGNY